MGASTIRAYIVIRVYTICLMRGYTSICHKVKSCMAHVVLNLGMGVRVLCVCTCMYMCVYINYIHIIVLKWIEYEAQGICFG